MRSLFARAFVGIVGVFVASAILWSLFSALEWSSSVFGAVLGVAFTLGGAFVLAVILLAASKSFLVTAGMFVLVGVALLVATVSSTIADLLGNLFAWPFHSLGGAIATAALGALLGSFAPSYPVTVPPRGYIG